MNKDPVYLPLESLLQRLEQTGIRVDPVGRLRIMNILHALGAERLADKQVLCDALGPLIVQSKSEQERFSHIFQQWWEDEVMAPLEFETSWEEEKSNEHQEENTLNSFGKKWGKWPKVSLVLLLLAIVIYFVYYHSIGLIVLSPNLSSQCLFGGDLLRIDFSKSEIFPFEEADIQKEYIICDYGDGILDTMHASSSGLFSISFEHHYQKEGQYTVNICLGNEQSIITFRGGSAIYMYLDSLSRSCLSFPVYVSEALLPMAIIDIDPESPQLGQPFSLSSKLREDHWQYDWNVGADHSSDGPVATFNFQEQEIIRAQLTVSILADTLGLCTDETSRQLDLRNRREIIPIREFKPKKDIEQSSYRLRPWFGEFIFILGLVLLFFGWRWYRSLLLGREEGEEISGKEAPYRPPFPQQDQWLTTSPAFYALAQAFRVRQQGSRPFLHLPTTLEASIRQGGFPTLHYQYHSQPANWLILIERSGEDDHQGRLFQAHFERLIQEEIHLQIYYFFQDPRQCKNLKGEVYLLKDLAQRYADHRLLIVSRGDSLFDQYEAAIPSWISRDFATWTRRVWLSPKALEAWGWREELLHQHFLLMPAHLEGQLAAVQELDDPLEEEDKPSFSTHLRRLQRQFGVQTSPDSLAEDLNHLRKELGEKSFSWLAAAALYPRPSWEITLAVSQKLEGGALEFNDLLALSDLPWLRDGDLDPDLRTQLIASLPAAQEQLGRQSIIEVLRHTPIEKRSFAHKERETQIIINEAILAPKDEEKQAALSHLYEIEGLDHWANSYVEQKNQDAAANPRLPAIICMGLGALIIGAGILTEIGENWSSQHIDQLGLPTILLEHRPDSASIFNNLGVDAQLSDRMSEATFFYNRANLYYEQDSERVNMADYNLRLLQYEEAKKAYEEQNWANAIPVFSNAYIEGDLSFGDTLGRHSKHAEGLSYLYTRDTLSARYIAYLLEADFYLDFGKPNLLSLLSEVEMQEQEEGYLLSIRTGGLFGAQSDSTAIYATFIGDQDSMTIRLDSMESRGNRQFEANLNDHWLIPETVYLGTPKRLRLWTSNPGPGVDDWLIDRIELTELANGRTWTLPNITTWLGDQGSYSLPLSLNDPGYRGWTVQGQVLDIRTPTPMPTVAADLEINVFAKDRSQTQLVRTGRGRNLRMLFRRGKFTFSIPPEFRQQGFDSLLLRVWTDEIDTTELAIGLDQLPKFDLDIHLGGQAAAPVIRILAGSVRDESGKPITYTRIMETLATGGASILSDQQGGFRFMLPNESSTDGDSISIRIEVAGYEPKDTSLVFESDLRLDIILQSVLPAEESKQVQVQLRALNNIETFMNYCAIIADKETPFEDADKAIDLAIALFLNEESTVHVSEQNSPTKKTYLIRDYLNRLKLMKYDQVEIEWADIAFVDRIRLGPDSLYYGIVSSMQKFSGYRDGEVAYSDLTTKNTEVILKRDTILEGAQTWDVLLDEISVVLTRPQAKEISRPRMVRIPGGSFLMGSDEGGVDEQPPHLVTVPTFYLAETEVTIEQFCAFLNEQGNQVVNGTNWLKMTQFVQIEKKNDVYVPKAGKEKHAVVGVSWDGAVAYCKWLGPGYRLPSEAEWEYAAGGGADNRTEYAGTNSMSLLSNYAVYNVNSILPVASRLPLSIGSVKLYDMSGNVWEWCQDRWHSSYKEAPKDGSPWEDGSSDSRVLRGGSWFDSGSYLRVSERSNGPPDFSNLNIGFRPARTGL